MVSKILVDSRLIGRSLDFPVPPEPYLMKNIFNASLFTWFDGINAGIRNSFGPTLIPVNFVLYAPIFLGIQSPWFIARYQIILTLFFSLTFFYLFAAQILRMYFSKIDLGIRNSIGIISSIFFVFNNYIFTEIIFGSNVMYMSLAFVPLLLYAFFRYISTSRISSLYLMTLSITIIGSTLQHLVLAYVFLLLLCMGFRRFKLFIAIAVLHVILSLYWILPLVVTFTQIQGTELASNYSVGLTKGASNFISALINMDYFGNRDMYRIALGDESLSRLWTINAYILLLVILSSTYFRGRLPRNAQKVLIIFSVIFLVAIVFLKGGREPFGNVIIALYEKIPILNLYRSLQHYLSFYIISASTMLFFSCAYLAQKGRKYLLLIFFFVTVNALPWWGNRDMGIENTKKHKFAGFNLFYLTQGDHLLYSLSNDPLESAILTIPPGQSINFIPTKHNAHFSQGSDTGLLYNNKRTYETEANMGAFQHAMDTLENDMYHDTDFFNKNRELFKILNIKYFVIRDDTTPNFSLNRAHYTTRTVKQALKKTKYVSIKATADDVIVLENNLFLPQIYSANTVYISNKEIGGFDTFGSNYTDRSRPLFLFNKQNKNLANYFNLDMNESRTIPYSQLPVIEYKKINPSKYAVSVHHARGNFFLVFSNSFHQWWDLYFYDTSKLRPSHLNGFISENISGSIQNDNLPNGTMFDTLLSEPYGPETHFVANGFANTWMIQTDKICQTQRCEKNNDGSYEFGLILEFMPQRLFNLGAILAIIVIVSGVLYGIFLTISSQQDPYEKDTT